MAEVLITLVIIGIIAAITIPVVMANHRKIETAAKVKKFYSNMTNAIRLAEIEEGKKYWEMCEESSIAAIPFMKQYFSHLNFIKITDPDIGDTLQEELDWWGNYSGDGGGGYQLSTSGSGIFYLNDGSMFSTETCGYQLNYDVNGLKGPNKSGRDIFTFSLVNGSMIESYPEFQNYNPIYTSCYTCNSWEGNSCTRQELISKCETDRECCTKLLEMDGWEFKDDYPHRI